VGQRSQTKGVAAGGCSRAVGPPSQTHPQSLGGTNLSVVTFCLPAPIRCCWLTVTVHHVHIIGTVRWHVATNATVAKLADRMEGKGPRTPARGQTASGADGTNLWIAARGPAVSCRARSLFPSPLPFPRRLIMGFLGRGTGHGTTTPRTEPHTTPPPARAHVAASQPGRTPAQQHQARAGGSFLPQPSLSRRASLLRERAAKQPPSPLLFSPSPFIPRRRSVPKVSPLSAPATRPGRSERSGPF
jgi:hypothetical protein